MKKRLIVLFLSIILSLPFWFLTNLSQFHFENLLAKEMGADNVILTAKAVEFMPKDIDVEADSALSAELTEKGIKVLYSKNSSQKMPIASLTKLMTSLVVLDLKGSYDISQEIPISQEAVNRDGESNLVRGDILNVDNLLHMALMESSNDAAYALTNPLGKEAFVDLMNLYTEDIGLKNTYFFNPTGLEPDNPEDPLNFSTAEDMVFLSEYILKEHPEIFYITKKTSFEVKRKGGIIHHFIPENTNQLLKELPQIVGGKTGWTPKAKGCLLVLIEDEKKDKLFINIVLGSQDRFSDMRKIIKEVNRIKWEN